MNNYEPQVGDRVYFKHYGLGTILCIKQYLAMPILVEFDNEHPRLHEGRCRQNKMCKPKHGWWFCKDMTTDYCENDPEKLVFVYRRV